MLSRLWCEKWIWPILLVTDSLCPSIMAGEMERIFRKQKRRTKAMRKVAASHVFDLTDMRSDFHLVQVSTGPDANLMLLWLEKTADNTSKDGGRQIRPAGCVR